MGGVGSHNYNLVAITEMWWHQSHNWSSAANHSEGTGKDREAGELLFILKKWIDCTELSLKTSAEQVLRAYE